MTRFVSWITLYNTWIAILIIVRVVETNLICSYYFMGFQKLVIIVLYYLVVIIPNKLILLVL